MILSLQVIFLHDALVLRKSFLSNLLETFENEGYLLVEVWIMTRKEINEQIYTGCFIKIYFY